MKPNEFIDKLLHNISGIFKNGSDRWSSMRFAFILSVIISNNIIFGAWIGLSFMKHKLVEIPESVLVLYALANGISYAGKTTQRYIEKEPKQNKA